MEEPILFKKQLSFIYLLISLLYLAAIFNFSLYLKLYNQIGRSDLSSLQVAGQRLVHKRSIVADKLSQGSDGSLLDQDSSERFSLDQLGGQLSRQNKNDVNADNADKPRERFKRSHQFDLADFDLRRVWLSEDESLKQKLISNYRSDDDETGPSVRRAKKVRSVNEDKLVSTESPTLHPPPGAHSPARSVRHRQHHQKRRPTATTTTESSSGDQSAEFFSQPQSTTGQENGKVWVNSYSRIPVSHVCNVFLIQHSCPAGHFHGSARSFVIFSRLIANL